jgi:tRNA-2-methylthio-N6-dimethylallyladenosine synthase
MKAYIRTFGCQMNKLDSEMVENDLVHAGYSLAESEADADIILFNTCSVRKSAEERVYNNLQLLKKFKDKKPELIIGLIGCMAEKEKESAFKKIPFLDIICGPNQERKIPEMIEKARQNKRVIVNTGDSSYTSDVIPRVSGTAPSAFVLAMRGCDNYCSYCVVPYVRGSEISRPISEILVEANSLVERGVKEITLLGQNISSYGKGINTELPELLSKLHGIKELKRIRFVTSHPAFTKDDLFKVMKDLPKVSPYIHMPAQSGSDKILKAMNRKYTRSEYIKIIEGARKILPGIEFGSDFIVGFPGETESDFKDTMSLMNEIKFISSFVFKYSIRPGTSAALLDDNIPYKVKQERNNILLAVQSEISKTKNQYLIGKELEILVEGENKKNPGRLQGRSPQNQIVFFEGAKSLIGKITKVKITAATALSLRGIKENNPNFT